MKTEFKPTVKDNLASAAALAATFIAIAGAVVETAEARAAHASAQPPFQQMETISVTAPRTEVATLETMLVIASRDARTLVALE